MPLTKIDISSRNRVDIKNHYLCFAMLQLTRSWDKRMLFFFHNQIYFPFSFSCTFLIGTLKKTEYNSIHKVFASFFNRHNSTFHSSNSFSSKGEGNLVNIVVGSLAAWIGVVTINWPAQANFFQVLQKQPLKYVWQNSYQDLWSYTLRYYLTRSSSFS